MLEQRLIEIIPTPNSTFPKLESGDPYHFDQWRTDLNNEMCLYYWFWNLERTGKNKKRVVISEVEDLIRNCLTQGHISRNDFKKYCHTSNSAGPCGFAVMGRMLEYLGIAQYLGWGRGFEIIDRDLAEQLIKMERICDINGHGANRAQIEIGKDVDKFFSKEQRDIVLHIDNNKYYSELPDCFFTTCKHLRTAYDDQTYNGTNRLQEWVINSNVMSAKLEVITKYKEFRLSKYESNQ